jgi:DNA-binding transcriptional ArsR family regulator
MPAKPLKYVDPDLILHPVRVRILYALEGRELTPGQIALEAPDVPQASLYRHIKKLLDVGILVVCGERQVHGTVERTYKLEAATYIDPKEFAARRGKAEQYFEVFLGALRRAFVRMMAGRLKDLKKHGVTFYSEIAYLTDEEHLELNRAIRKLITEAQEKAPAPGRMRRMMAVIGLPEPPLNNNKPKTTKENP